MPVLLGARDLLGASFAGCHIFGGHLNLDVHFCTAMFEFHSGFMVLDIDNQFILLYILSYSLQIYFVPFK